MKDKVTKAIFPVAGMGTRFLPATKSVPKEIMTLVDRPLVQYAIDEAREAGIEEFIFVTSRGKGALEDYFDNAPQLERLLEERGKTDLLDILRETDMRSGQVAYVRQYSPRGLGDAVFCARRLIGDEPFAVILPDDIIDSQTSCLGQMVEAYAENPGNVVAAMEVSPDQTDQYGILDPSTTQDRIVALNGLVEKPSAEQAPSNLAVIGRYILTPGVFRHLAAGKMGAGGEIQLTDAINDACAAGEPVHGFLFDGKRFDCGSKAGYLRATVAFALKREEFREEFRDFLTEIASS